MEDYDYGLTLVAFGLVLLTIVLAGLAVYRVIGVTWFMVSGLAAIFALGSAGLD